MFSKEEKMMIAATAGGVENLFVKVVTLMSYYNTDGFYEIPEFDLRDMAKKFVVELLTLEKKNV